MSMSEESESESDDGESPEERGTHFLEQNLDMDEIAEQMSPRK
jgi:hypothetical protein